MTDDEYSKRVTKWRSRRLGDARELARLVKDLVEPRREIRGLDFGCNDGEMQEEMNRLGWGLAVEGADANPAAVAKAASLGRTVRQVRNGFRTDLDNHRFDFVMCIATLAHIDKQASAMIEMCRLTRPGGVLIIETPDPLYDILAAPKHWLTGYRGDPTIVQKVWRHQLDRLVPCWQFEKVGWDRTGVRLPWPLGRLPITSDYRAVYRRST